MQQTTPPWGQHLILDLAGCPRERLTNPEHLRTWIRELVNSIDMRPYGEPQIEHFATHSNAAAGYTVVQLIETSNICAHFAENLGQAFIDIFSCKTFQNDRATAICKDFFSPTSVIARPVSRGAFPAPLAEAG
jgi:S-adenosylmethionine decarboxylase